MAVVPMGETLITKKTYRGVGTSVMNIARDREDTVPMMGGVQQAVLREALWEREWVPEG